MPTTTLSAGRRRAVALFAAVTIAAGASPISAQSDTRGADADPDPTVLRGSYPVGDVHVDRGVEITRRDRAAMDVIGIDGRWDAAGVVVDVRHAGSITQADANPALILRALDPRGTVQAVTVWEPSANAGYQTSFESAAAFAECGISVTRVAQDTWRTTYPPACLEGDVTTLYFRAYSMYSPDNGRGWSIQASDLSEDINEYRFPVPSLTKPGVEPTAQPVQSTGEPAVGAADEDPSPDVLRWSDPAGDLETSGAVDLLAAQVSVAGGRLSIRLEGDGIEPQADFTAYVVAADGGALNWKTAYGVAADGTSIGEVTYRLPGDRGRRVCDRHETVVGDGFIELQVSVLCGFVGDVVWVYVRGEDDSLLGEGSAVLAAVERPRATAADIAATCDGKAPQTDFSDIDGNVHAPRIRCISHHGITQGKADGSYAPKETLSRGQIATFLVRTLEAAGRDLPAATTSDCAGSPHADNLNRLVDAGIMDRFGCEMVSEMTRYLMADATARAIDWAMETPSTVPDYFADDDHLVLAAQVRNLLVAHFGVVTGKADGSFAPHDLLPRDQMATFLARLLAVLS